MDELKRIEEIKGVGPQTKKLLNGRGFFTVKDLLYYFPIRYEIRKNIKSVSEFVPGKEGWVKGLVSKVKLSFTRFKRMPIVTVYFHDGRNYGKAVFFNQRFLIRAFKRGEWVLFYGKSKNSDEEKILFSIVPSKYESFKSEPVESVIPVYGRVGRLTSKKIQRLISEIFNSLKIEENIPFEILKKYKFPPRADSLKAIHFPTLDKIPSLSILEVKRLIFEEFFFFQLSLAFFRKKEREREKKRKLKEFNIIKIMEESEGIRFTSSQRQAISEIIEDFRKKTPMKRLLQGDVGSGKTFVALATALFMIRNGYQVAFMAPTEILAAQHFSRIKEMKAFKNVEKILLLGSMTTSQKRKMYQRIESGDAKFIVGTHALFQEKVKYKNLSYVIVDEQHRFGVAQRTALSLKGKCVELLVMTATPIPRSLYLTIYSDLSVSVLKEFPFGEKRIKTYIVKENERKKLFDWVYEKVKEGKQGFIVYPLIEESDRVELKALETAYEKLKKAYPDLKIGILHGRMKAADKEKVRGMFEKKELMLLITTSIIEVGIDIKDALFIIIEHPERYGLSQLHQMRGRVGRREEGYCFLIKNRGIGEAAKRRLEIIKNISDGFKIAEEDLRLRGSGDPLGKQQWGDVVFKIADPVRDIEILEIAKKEAYTILEKDKISDKIEKYFNYLENLRKEVDFN